MASSSNGGPRARAGRSLLSPPGSSSSDDDGLPGLASSSDDDGSETSASGSKFSENDVSALLDHMSWTSDEHGFACTNYDRDFPELGSASASTHTYVGALPHSSSPSDDGGLPRLASSSDDDGSETSVSGSGSSERDVPALLDPVPSSEGSGDDSKPPLVDTESSDDESRSGRKPAKPLPQLRSGFFDRAADGKKKKSAITVDGRKKAINSDGSIECEEKVWYGDGDMEALPRDVKPAEDLKVKQKNADATAMSEGPTFQSTSKQGTSAREAAEARRKKMRNKRKKERERMRAMERERAMERRREAERQERERVELERRTKAARLFQRLYRGRLFRKRHAPEMDRLRRTRQLQVTFFRYYKSLVERLERDKPAPGECREFWTGCKRAQFSQSIKDGEGDAGEEAAFMDCTAALKEIENASKAAAMAENVALDEDGDAGGSAAGSGPDDDEEAGSAPREEKARNDVKGTSGEEEDDEDPGDAPAGIAGLCNIFLTPAALKWVSTAETNFVNLFLRRVRQLASGQRSRILKKSLTGSKHAIWETYLDMKTAQRILWTEVIEEGDPAARAAAGAVAGTAGSSRKILIWYIARHDWVNRLMRKIDESGAKLNRRAARSANEMLEEDVDLDGLRLGEDVGLDSEALRLGPEQMLIDPLSYVPLKLHQVDYGDLEMLRNRQWSPPLRLTSTERAVIETQGSVLLLGRSGTGKTVCISSRISHDQQMCRPGAPLHQLFVSRNYRICRMVESLAGGEVNDQEAEAARDASHFTSFMTFNKLLDRCTRLYAPALAQTYSMSRHGNGNYVRFATFRDDFYAAYREERGAVAAGVDALLVWTQIRSFICGSIEAVEQSIRSGGVASCVPLEAYLDREKFSAGRCRLTDEQRRAAYACFERYRGWKAAGGLWDDSDRILGTLGGVIRGRRAAGDLGVDAGARGEMSFDRVYVDEVQDFTQAEIALFFLICRSGRLFLAGDMAQAVEQGVDFRFEEVRSVVFALSKGRERIDKPLTLTLNFRSHAGVLRLAAFVLDRLFAAFPTAAKKLPPDEGLFEGPRPGILEVMEPDKLRQLCNRYGGLVCVTHDEHAQECAEICGRNSLVLGIVEAKGLEFSDVVIVNFFSKLGGRHQAPWKDLIRSSRAGAAGGFENRHPELEGHLKLLYTAITRCCHRLFFVETAASAAWPAFDRWLTGQGVAERCAATTDVDAALRTADEWRALGMDMALDKIVNDGDAVFDRRPNLMPNALKCFRNAGDGVLAKKAEVHIQAAKVYAELVGAPVIGAKFHLRLCAVLEELVRENLLYEAASLAAGVALRTQRLDVDGGGGDAGIHGLIYDWIVQAIFERLP